MPRGTSVVGKILDRLLLFLYSLIVAAAAAILAAAGFHLVSYDYTLQLADLIYHNTAWAIPVISVSAVIFLISLRFLYISLRSSRRTSASIDQHTDFGDVRISMETVENLTLKAASRVKGVKDLKAKVNVSDAGLEISIRAIVDGESSIPQLTEEVQRQVKGHVEETTGIPVSFVTLFVANIIQSQSFRSRVE